MDEALDYAEEYEDYVDEDIDAQCDQVDQGHSFSFALLEVKSHETEKEDTSRKSNSQEKSMLKYDILNSKVH